MTSSQLNEPPMTTLPREVEFIQVITVDVNGYSRGKMFPREKWEDLLKDKEEIVCLIEVMGTSFEIPNSIKELANNHFRNNYMVLDKPTLRVSPWSKDSSLAMVFYDSYDKDTKSPFPFNPRLIAKNQIKELEKIGLKILTGVENEFRLFDKATKKPLYNEILLFDQFTQSTLILPYFKELRNRLNTVDIQFDSCNLEYGEGQLEIPLKTYTGIEGIDKIWLFRQVSKHVADDMGLIASYMTKPLWNGIASGMHINHSLWKETEKGPKNVMWAPLGYDELSEIGKYWLAGILKHAKALSAFFSPTINCYRRIRSADWSPNLVSWNYRDRSVAMRVKTSKDNEKMNYIENRIPSSACNIYLAVAGMIAAGLDGIKNKYELIEPGNGSHCEDLPKSLGAALDALRNDKVLADSLGAKFVEWYIMVKTETEVDLMKDVDIGDFSEKGIAKECAKYFKL